MRGIYFCIMRVFIDEFLKPRRLGKHLLKQSYFLKLRMSFLSSFGATFMFFLTLTILSPHLKGRMRNA